MFKISSYHIDLVPLPHKPQRYSYRQSQINHIKGLRTIDVGNGFPVGGQPLLPHALPCRTAQTVRAFKQAGRFADGDVACIYQLLGETFHARRHQCLQIRPGRGRKPIMDCTSCSQSYRTGQAERQQSSRSLAEGRRQGSERPDIQAFFISTGARYKRIRECPRVPSPQLYAYKAEKLQELEHLNIDGKVDLYYTDESHVCTDGYVPYGWQFKDENVYIPSEKTQNLRHDYPKKSIQGFTTQESINADRLMDFLDRLSFEVKKKTVVVLDYRNGNLPVPFSSSRRNFFASSPPP